MAKKVTRFLRQYFCHYCNKHVADRWMAYEYEEGQPCSEWSRVEDNIIEKAPFDHWTFNCKECEDELKKDLIKSSTSKCFVV